VSFYTRKLLPNRKTLLDKGYMMKAFPEIKELVHFSNYRVNPAIKEEEVKAIEELRVKDPNIYDVVGIGLPGTTQGGAYAHLNLNLESK
jgi:hypothetical protein